METFDLFTFLDDASPWWWIAFALALGVIELVTFTYFVIWLVPAAFAVGVIHWIAPISGAWQLAIFAILAAALTVAGRYWLARRPEIRAATPGLNRRSERIVGRTGKALATFENGEGEVMVDGVRWRARLEDGAAAAETSLKVVGADGMTLICKPL